MIKPDPFESTQMFAHRRVVATPEDGGETLQHPPVPPGSLIPATAKRKRVGAYLAAKRAASSRRLVLPRAFTGI